MDKEWIEENIGWLVLGSAILLSLILLLSVPASVNIQEDSSGNSSDPSIGGIGEIPEPIALREHFSDYLSAHDRSLFQLPQRWVQLPPSEPARAPVPGVDRIQLPSPIFVFPLPEKGGASWSAVPGSIETSELPAVDFSSFSFDSLASAARDENQNAPAIPENVSRYDRVLNQKTGKWLKGHVVEKGSNFIRFREFRSGEVRRLKTPQIKLIEYKTPEQQFRNRREQLGDSPNNSDIIELVSWATRNGLYMKAAAEMEKLIRRNKTDLSYYLRAGRLYRLAGKPEKERALYKRALSQDILAKHRIHYQKALLEWNLGLDNTALRTLDRSIESRPLNLKARLHKIVLLAKLDSPEKIRTEIKNLRDELSSISSEVRRDGIRTICRVLYRWESGNRQEAMNLVSELSFPDPGKTEFGFLWKWAYLFKSRYFIRNGESDRAFKVLQSGLSDVPGTYELWYNLAVLGYLSGNKSISGRALDVCQTLSPYRAEHGIVRLHLQKNPPSSSNVSNITSGGRRIPYLYARGKILLKLEEVEEASGSSFPGSALDVLKTLYAEDPSFVPGATGLAYALIQDQQWESARVVLQENVPESWLRNYLMSLAIGRTGNYQEALNLLESTPLPRDAELEMYQRCLEGEMLVRTRNLREASKRLNIPPRFSDLKSYADEIKKIVQSSQTRLLFRDDFQRKKTESERKGLGYGWGTNSGEYGVVVQLRNRAAVFEGTQTGENGFTRMWQETDPSSFRLAEFVGRVQKKAEGLIFGIALLQGEEGSRHGFLLGVKGNGQVVITRRGFARRGGWRPLKDVKVRPFESGSKFHLKVYRKERKGNRLQWFFEVLGEKKKFQGVRLNTRGDSGPTRVFYFAGANSGSNVSLRVDKFRLIHKK